MGTDSSMTNSATSVIAVDPLTNRAISWNYSNTSISNTLVIYSSFPYTSTSPLRMEGIKNQNNQMYWKQVIEKPRGGTPLKAGRKTLRGVIGHGFPWLYSIGTFGGSLNQTLNKLWCIFVKQKKLNFICIDEPMNYIQNIESRYGNLLVILLLVKITLICLSFGSFPLFLWHQTLLCYFSFKNILVFT